jgi:hypothetical protein
MMEGAHYDLDDRIEDWEVVDKTNIALKRPIEVRLLHLLELLDVEAHERTSRRELVAALIYRAPLSGRKLAAFIRQYRRATARDALPPTSGSASMTQLCRRPGPRRHRRNG